MSPASMIDVIVCSTGRPAELDACIRSVERQTVRPAQLLLCLPHDEDCTIESDLPMSVVHSEPGLPIQRNAALEYVESELVAFIDDDVVLAPDYLEAVCAWFADHESCVGVSGNVENDKRRRVVSRMFRVLFAMANDDGRLRRSGDAIYLHHPTEPTRVEFLSGCNMVYRSIVATAMKFDEALVGYAYMEDVDFSMRASLSGELWMLDAALLVHQRTPTSRVPKCEYVAQVFGNSAYLFAKHRRTFNLRRTAFLRRMVGRCLAYLVLAVAQRSVDPAAGVWAGLLRVPGMLRRGAATAYS